MNFKFLYFSLKVVYCFFLLSMILKHPFEIPLKLYLFFDLNLSIKISNQLSFSYIMAVLRRQILFEFLNSKIFHFHLHKFIPLLSNILSVDLVKCLMFTLLK